MPFDAQVPLKKSQSA